ncbi:MAG: hypothetical protein ACR2HP_10735 [Ilumatobacteraceae bacterium]
MGVRRGLRRVRRLVWLAAIVGGVVGVRKKMASRRPAPALGPPASWPPLERSEPPVAAVGDLATAADPRPTPPADAGVPVVSDEPTASTGSLMSDAGVDADGSWVAADDGECPLSHPIKANTNSMIFHTPGGRFYERTRAERCYADPTAAEADGYRAARGA